MVHVNALIQELVRSLRKATAIEIEAVIAHVAKAPFATYLARVPNDLRRALEQKDIAAPAKLPSLEWHLLKRIYDEQQWPTTTTADRYITDLQQSILHPAVGIWTYQYFSRPCVGFLAPSHIQDAPLPLPYLFVVYDPQYGTITTGYQASGLSTVFDTNCSRIVRHK